MGRYKNKLLFAIFHVMLIVFLFAACSLDSLSLKPLILFIITGLWITVFISVNWRFFMGVDDEDY